MRAPVPVMRRGPVRRAPPKPKDNTPINDMIKFEQMRVMAQNPGEADEFLGVMSKADALAEAEKRGLDLVLVTTKGDVPVCKIISFDKYRYDKEKKQKELKRAASTSQKLKELKMSYRIGIQDFEVRKKQAVRFLQQGDKVKFSMFFRGREIVFSDKGREVMLDMATALEDVGVLEGKPKVEGRQMIMMIVPKPSK